MDPTSTTRGLTRVIKPLRGPGYGWTAGSFRGVIQPAFSAWIRTRWGFSRSGWFRPVARDFYKQQSPFELVRWPRPNRVGKATFTFSPTIQLTCFSDSSSNTLFDIEGTRVSQSLTMQLNPRTSLGARLLASSSADKRRNSTEQRAIIGRIRIDQSLMLLDRRRSVGVLKSHRALRSDESRLPEYFSSLFSTAFQSVKGITLGGLPRSGMDPGAPANSLGGMTRPAVDAFVDGSTTGPSLNWWLQTRAMDHRLEHSFLMRVRDPKIGRESRSALNYFTTISLNLLAPKAAEAEMVNRRIAHFVSSPALTFARREQALSEGIIHALQDLRVSQSQSKAVAVPQLPSIEYLTSQVRTQLERELKIEKERRGL